MHKKSDWSHLFAAMDNRHHLSLSQQCVCLVFLCHNDSCATTNRLQDSREGEKATLFCKGGGRSGQVSRRKSLHQH